MNPFSKITPALLIAALLFIIPALAADIQVVLIPKFTGGTYFESVGEGALTYAAQHGFTVSYAGSPEASVANQVAIIQNAINSGAGAVCLSSVDATGLDEIMKEAMAAGLAVITWDSDISGDARSLMVSQGTPEVLGGMLVDMLAQSLTERGKDVHEDTIKYLWHYSRASASNQNSWMAAGEKYIRRYYPNWVNAAPQNYYSGQNAQKAIMIGESILTTHEDLDGIICSDTVALPGQAQAAFNLGMTKEDISITGFAPPSSIEQFARGKVLTRWAFWDSRLQGAMACFFAYFLASGNSVKVGDLIGIPDIGIFEVLPNTVLDAEAYTAVDSGVILLPKFPIILTLDNMDKYDF